MTSTVRFMKNLWQDEDGALAAEYELIFGHRRRRHRGRGDRPRRRDLGSDERRGGMYLDGRG